MFGARMPEILTTPVYGNDLGFIGKRFEERYPK
jgi:hypothetical protein